jgi:hypothetical protein
MNNPMMGPAKPVSSEDRVGFRREVAIGKKQQFDALTHLLIL